MPSVERDHEVDKHVTLAYDCRNKQQFFPRSGLTGWTMYSNRTVFTVSLELITVVLGLQIEGQRNVLSLICMKRWEEHIDGKG
jgi:hypothetical protein